ncbi:hypothetical protein M758_3G261300 [Ceratodon purpureus]|nr:hypothetical protein M758_3G261300 [Ceratodon purpureus]
MFLWLLLPLVLGADEAPCVLSNRDLFLQLEVMGDCAEHMYGGFIPNVEFL